MACSLCSYMVAFQDQYTLPNRNILSKLLLWLVHMEFPFRTSTPSEREIFSQSCYCGLLSVLIYGGLSGPAHPPKEKYSLKLLLWLALSTRIQWPFRTTTPYQREIFSQSCYCGLFIWRVLPGPAHPPKVKYSLSKLLLLLVPMEFPFTPSQRKIFSHSCYCDLFVWSFISLPSHPPKVKDILSKLLLWLVHSARIQ